MKTTTMRFQRGANLMICWGIPPNQRGAFAFHEGTQDTPRAVVARCSGCFEACTTRSSQGIYKLTAACKVQPRGWNEESKPWPLCAADALPLLCGQASHSRLFRVSPSAYTPTKRACDLALEQRRELAETSTAQDEQQRHTAEAHNHMMFARIVGKEPTGTRANHTTAQNWRLNCACVARCFAAISCQGTTRRRNSRIRAFVLTHSFDFVIYISEIQNRISQLY